MRHAWTRWARIEVRTTRNVKALLQRAAAVSCKNVTEFLFEARIDAAEDLLAGRRVFHLDARRWRAFQGVLDRPVADNPRLARKSALE